MVVFKNLSFFIASVTVSLAAYVVAEPAFEASGTRYIVRLKDSAATTNAVGRLAANRRGFGEDVQVWDSALHGFAARLDEEELRSLQRSPDVLSIEKDGTVTAYSSVTQFNATWGLARISSRTLPGRDPVALYPYTYDSSGGAGVDIYVLDSGVRTTHIEFAPNRAVTGAVFGGYLPEPGHGHGTHCAGTAAGVNVGVAKQAKIISVRVLSDAGSGSISNVVSGLNWILTNARATGRPSVVLIALGGSASTAVDSAVTSLTSAGIHVVVAAGSSNTNANNSSPQRVPSVILVSACNILDARASFSDYGTAIDIFAPGVNVYSSWHTADNAYQTLSGNSMAAAHVAGVVAYLIGLEGNVTPAGMATKLANKSTKNILTGVPAGTVNAIAYMGP